MQNGDDFYLIDMQQAANSTFYKEVVPEEKRRKDEEDWIPRLEEGKKLLLTKENESL